MIIVKFLLPTLFLVLVVLTLYWFSKDLKEIVAANKKLFTLLVVTILAGLVSTFILAYTFNIQVM
jgi:hypothetical protein